MKILKLFILLAALVFFGACQKELGFDNGASIGALVKNSTTGDCMPASVVGIFMVDSVLTTANYVDVQVNVSIMGTFEVKSDTVNGFSFYKSGNVGDGANTIRLYPSGKSLAPGTFTFTITYGSSLCKFDITVVSTAGGTAIYTLGGSPSTCSGFTTTGTCTAGIALGAANTVTFNVNVTTPGTYSITTGTPAVNGMTYSGSGTFTNPGVQTVTLTGSGTPLSAGNFNFTPTNGTSPCTFSVNVAGSAASYTLNGGPAPSTCSGAVLHGTYAAGTALNAGDTVELFANVTAPGSYSITTGSPVNGISFSGTGVFMATGTAVRVVLTGTGTPVNGGPYNYTPAGGTSTCVFSVTATGTVPPANLDYIPETVNSNWTDSLVGGLPTDTSYTVVSNSTTVQGGQTYKVFRVLDAGSPVDSSYHRSGAGKYYEYYYTNLGIFDNPVNKEMLLIDSTLSTGGNWSVTFPPNTIGASPATMRIDAIILAKGATATIVGNNYSNVLKVKFTYNLDVGTGFTPFGEEEFWYAKGLGLIYDKLNDVPVTTITEYVTKRIQIF
jgi:hypothetical protein